MEDKVKSFENEVIKQVYSTHAGEKILPYTKSLNVESEVMIFSASNIDLIDAYIHEEKRNYVLLDKDIDIKYLKKQFNNTWYIPTDLKFPTLILVDNTVLHIPFNLINTDIETYKGIREYYIFLIQTYVKRMSGNNFEYDIINPKTSKIRTHSVFKDLAKDDTWFISNTITNPNLVTTVFKKDLNQNYIKLDASQCNPLDVVRKKKLNCVIYNDKQVIELLTEFDFDLQHFSYNLVFDQISYKDAYAQRFYNLNGDLINVLDNIDETITLKLDYRQSQNRQYVDNEINKMIEALKPKKPTLKQTFKINFTQLKLSDFENLKKLTSEDILKEIKELELVDELYRSSKGLIALVSNPTVELLKYSNIKYIVSK